MTSAARLYTQVQTLRDTISMHNRVMNRFMKEGNRQGAALTRRAIDSDSTLLRKLLRQIETLELEKAYG